MTRVVIGVALSLAAAACGSSSSAASTSSGSSSASTGSGGGASSITGSVNGTPFDTAQASYRIGASDDPAKTTVVYVFSAEVACSDLAMPGWDTRIPDKTAVLEMKAIGTSPGAYAVSGAPNPTMGEAAVNHTLSSTAAAPVETGAKSGTVTLTMLPPAMDASGTFDLTFPNGSLKGSFVAAWCAEGHEP